MLVEAVMEERRLIVWINDQGFPSALLCHRAEDLRSGVVLHELAMVIIGGAHPAGPSVMQLTLMQCNCAVGWARAMGRKGGLLPVPL